MEIAKTRVKEKKSSDSLETCQMRMKMAKQKMPDNSASLELDERSN